MKIHVDVTITDDNGNVIISRKAIELLSNVDQTGSISGAAKKSDLTYKRAWDILNTLGTGTNKPVLSTTIGGIDGGGTHLTETGGQLLLAYTNMHNACVQAAHDNLQDVIVHVE